MSRVYITQADILRVLDGGRRLSLTQLMSKFGVSHSCGLRQPIKDLLSSGELMRRREDTMGDGNSTSPVYIYYTSEPIPVGKPYHNMHLTETLSGWEASLRRHADLCMATRRAA